MRYKLDKTLFVFIVVLLLAPTFIYADSFKIFDQDLESPFENLLIPGFDSEVSSTEWQFVNKLKGINNYHKNIPDTDAKAYKGVCVINSPLKTVFSVIEDVKNHYKWVKFCKSSQMVKKTSESDSMQYYQFDIPWPFSNRDMVIHSTIDTDWEKGKISITSTASGRSEIPENDTFIRVVNSKQKWVLEKISPDSTRVTFTSYTPLNTSDSSLLKKIAATTIPFSTLEKLKMLSSQKYKTETSGYIVRSDAGARSEKDLKTRSYN